MMDEQRGALSKQLSSDRLLLDPLRVADADEMVSVLSDPQLYTFIGGTPPALTALRARYAQQQVGLSEDGSQLWLNWIVRRRDDHEAVGYVQATVTSDPTDRRRSLG